MFWTTNYNYSARKKEVVGGVWHEGLLTDIAGTRQPEAGRNRWYLSAECNSSYDFRPLGLLRADDLEQRQPIEPAGVGTGSDVVFVPTPCCYQELPLHCQRATAAANSLGLVLGLMKWVMICAPSRSHW